MTKSDFYKLWYTRLEDQELNDSGYPNVIFKGDSITTEKQWEEFLTYEMEVDDLLKVNKEACDLLKVEYVEPYKDARVRDYPLLGEQLDGIYKSLLSIKNSGVDLGPEGDAYLDSITEIKEKYPKN